MESKMVKWTMLSNRKFIGELEEYQIAIETGGIGSYWCITKDGIIIDECYRHVPLDGELNTKGFTQRLVNKLIHNTEEEGK